MLTSKWIPTIVGSLAPALMPPAHIGVLWYFWKNYSRHVDKRFCSCSCWDTVFKGPYESGIASYKHMYFNATLSTFKIWLLSVISIISLYECFKKIVKLLLKNQARYSMILLFISSIYSHYYSWWSFVNYYNDDFFSQWIHQLIFSVTEIISTIKVIDLINKDRPMSTRSFLCIIGISILHISAGSWDQFIHNVLLGEGHNHQIVRDISLMIPDILHFCVPIWLLKKSKKELLILRPGKKDCMDPLLKRDIAIMIACILLLLGTLSVF